MNDRSIVVFPFEIFSFNRCFIIFPLAFAWALLTAGPGSSYVAMAIVMVLTAIMVVFALYTASYCIQDGLLIRKEFLVLYLRKKRMPLSEISDVAILPKATIFGAEYYAAALKLHNGQQEIMRTSRYKGELEKARSLILNSRTNSPVA